MSTTACAARILDSFNQGRRKAPISFEIFPPKGDLTLDQAREVAGGLAQLGPSYISVTCSAGGSSVAGKSPNATARTVSVIQEEFNVPGMAHVTCIGATEESLQDVIADLKQRNISTVLALRGDLVEGAKPGPFKLAVDLIPRLKEAGFTVAAAAYPEGHVDCLDPRENIRHLKLKQDAGADFFVTQLFFSNDVLYRFLEDAHQAGVTAPIDCGVMPFMSKSQIQRMVFMCGASLPSPIIKLLAKYEGSEDDLLKAGVEYAAQQLVDLDAHGVDGLHLYSMNRPAVARACVEAVRAARA